MTRSTATAITTTTPTALVWEPPKGTTPSQAGVVVCSWLDTAATSFGRATHYNTREEQQEAEIHTHAALLRLDRDLYTAFLTLPGVTDRARQMGLRNLLSTPRNGTVGFLSAAVEREVLYRVINELPATRALKIIEAFRVSNAEQGIAKANNARTRKLILRTLLGSTRIELWAVKYRSKMGRALTHAWGRRKASIVRSILAKPGNARTNKERGILASSIDKHTGSNETGKVYQCVAFILGAQANLSLPLLKAFEAAKTDLSKGKRLPIEVLYGLRSQYHKDVPKEKILEITKDSLTKGQRLTIQKRAKEAGVKVDMDPRDYDAVKLYIYAFETGMTEEISDALMEKAAKAAEAFPASYGKVGIVVDASRSMIGSSEQRLRPMAATLALRDMLSLTGDSSDVTYVGGTFNEEDHQGATKATLARPQGETSIAEALVEVLQTGPDAVFVLSDGYENAPAGRFSEVVALVRDAGIETPIYHLNPVFAAEATGIRELAPAIVPTMPVQSPGGLGLTMLRGMLEAEPVKGINALLQTTLPAKSMEA